MQPPVLVAVDDLFFLIKIETAARQLGVSLIQVRSAQALESQLEAPTPPRLVILDLNSTACASLAAIRRIKSDPRLRETRTVGFFSHVQTELAVAAREAGCDLILPRSEFSAKLGEVLRTGSA